MNVCLGSVNQTLETQFEALSWQTWFGSRVPVERRTQRCGDSIGRKNHRQLPEGMCALSDGALRRNSEGQEGLGVFRYAVPA